MTAVDEIQPLLSDLVNTLDRTDLFAKGFDKSTMKDWLATLKGMRAADQLDEDQVRQLIHDLENGYSSFIDSMKG